MCAMIIENILWWLKINLMTEIWSIEGNFQGPQYELELGHWLPWYLAWSRTAMPPIHIYHKNLDWSIPHIPTWVSCWFRQNWEIKGFGQKTSEGYSQIKPNHLQKCCIWTPFLSNIVPITVHTCGPAYPWAMIGDVIDFKCKWCTARGWKSQCELLKLGQNDHPLGL